MLGHLRRLVAWVCLAALIAAPFVIWFAYPPSRVFLPRLAPITCDDGPICIDDQTRRREAQQLYDEAFSFVSQNVGSFAVPPKVIFCATSECSRHFGWEGTAGYNVGVFGMVIKPKGWVAHIVRHEMIHHLQNERLGMFAAYLDKPNWLLEGMAYSLSEDPRRPLAFSGDLEQQRAKFEAWYAGVGRENLWQAASRLSRNSP